MNKPKKDADTDQARFVKNLKRLDCGPKDEIADLEAKRLTVRLERYLAI